MDSYKEFKTLSASNAWAKERHLTWYTNFIKGSGYSPLDGLKEYAGSDVKYIITKVGKTYQLFYKKGD